MKRLVSPRLVPALTAALLLSSCLGSEDPFWEGDPASPVPEQGREQVEDGEMQRALVLISLGFNNISGSLVEDIEEFSAGRLPGRFFEDRAVFIFSHHLSPEADYRRPYATPEPPVLYRISSLRAGGIRRDTIKVYSTQTISASAGTIEDIFLTVRDNCEAKSYGMIFSSHASGWLPSGYDPGKEPGGSWDFFSFLPRKRNLVPTKSIGVQGSEKSSVEFQIEMEDFADALPYNLDYIIFDACLCGCAELFYAFKDKCRYIVASPTEVLTDGFVYKTLAANLLDGPSVVQGLEDCAREYFEQYSSRKSSATIALYDCSKADTLAAYCKTLMDEYGPSLPSIKKSTVQDYNYQYDLFYDLEDIVRQAGARQGQLDSLDAILSEAVLYKASTPSFISHKIDPARFCGMSMYLPYENRTNANTAYMGTRWNQATGVLRP